MIKIVTCTPPKPGDQYLNMGFEYGGPNNEPETFSQMDATLNDGTERTVYVSDKRTGYFRQVFVPWDFEHPAIAR